MVFWGCIVVTWCKFDLHPYFTEMNKAVLLLGRLLLSKGMNPFFFSTKFERSDRCITKTEHGNSTSATLWVLY